MDALFDYRKLAQDAGVSPEQLDELESLIRRDYGSDEMMVELRMLRTLRAVRDGAVSIAAAIAEFAGRSTPLRGAGWLDTRPLPPSRIRLALIAAAEADATVGEMMNTLKDVYGPYDGGPEM